MQGERSKQTFISLIQLGILQCFAFFLCKMIYFGKFRWTLIHFGIIGYIGYKRCTVDYIIHMLSKSYQNSANPTLSSAVGSRMNDSRQLQRPFLHKIPFGTGSVERKNVYKHLMRFLASTLNTNFTYYQDYLLEQGFSAVEIENITVSLEYVDKKEKQKGKGLAKDYANTIEMICGYTIGLHTLRLALVLWEASLLSIYRETTFLPKF
eukprot:TRINITY_DN15359_c0_g1_i1.p1 TRINITY_DN15359_c0_g1~~TRINITY_DN15359_c0_g1_i1.p1  ORF type:complete len:208 (+),score=9.18 TRINITY_DN15359_c0_g1_i1:372-995(+)